MGCLTARVARVDSGCMSASVSLLEGGGLTLRAEEIGEHIRASVVELSERIKAHCSIVCSISDYIKVEPDVIWLTPTTDPSTFVVISNVDWEIE